MALIHISAQTVPADTGYLSRKRKLEEIKLVSRYYNQDDNNAVVTGGMIQKIVTIFPIR